MFPLTTIPARPTIPLTTRRTTGTAYDRHPVAEVHLRYLHAEHLDSLPAPFAGPQVTLVQSSMELPLHWPEDKPPARFTVLETELSWPVRHPFNDFDSIVTFTATLRRPYSIIDADGPTIFRGNTTENPA